ncbi:MAG: glycosyltransferase family 2 protein [Patescibacteria group bacterium]|jgi:GT2 family glycosyltransferase
MKVSINLVTWNGKKYLPYCLDSIAKQTFRDFSLFILDNGSTDGTVEYLKNSLLPVANCRLEFNEENIGFAAGQNQALRETDSDYVLMLNQDIILEPNFLEEIIKFLDGKNEVAAVTGKLLHWDFPNNQKTDLIDSAGIKIFKNHRAIEFGAGEMDLEEWSAPREVFGVSGAAAVYRRAALNDVAINGEVFDEDFFSYKEDVDLAYRLRLAGFKAWFLPGARGYHDRSARSMAQTDSAVARARKNKSAFVNYHSYKNHLFFLLKNVSAGVCWRWGYRIKWYEFKKFIYLLFLEPRTLGSLGEFFKKFPKMWRKRKWIMKNKKADIAEIKKWFS